MTDELADFASVRPWGTVLLGKNVRCDGEAQTDLDRKIACISHIHEDHTSGFKDSLSQCDAVISSKTTKELLTVLHGSMWLNNKNNFLGLDFHEPYKYKDETITLFPSGHILGSAQILVESDDKKILYSGDYNVPGAEIVKDVDILVLDSTHGDPVYNDNEPREKKMDQIIKLVTEEIDELRPVIIRSARGKLQFLMHILRSKVKEAIPFVAKEDDRRVAEVYSKNGMPMGELLRDESNEFDKILKRNEPYVRFFPSGGELLPCELQGTRSIRVGNPPEYSIELTNMFQVNLTDHASFDGVMEYVSAIEPSLVITDNSGRSRVLTSVTLATEIKNKFGIETLILPKPVIKP